MAVLGKHRARVSFTCVEMRDCEHPPDGRCSPEGDSTATALASLATLMANHAARDYTYEGYTAFW